ncbi:pre-mRNA processing factor 3-domain-containing protein [Boletus edulis BED1]|uniref:Pre-mRNA processing factor 3-domain-containing protein n=1 Tax=Boletus edulis BED1 TaxID=1328754 RepID=A0AAD4GLF1_BOLED|nr:pre-mRNA processing factor 3-domain-containing protein [Boletus edulis BED1]
MHLQRGGLEVVVIETFLDFYIGQYGAKSGFEGGPKERTGRSFRFNPKGKYVQLGNQMRQETQFEALKQRIAQGARKAGLDSELLWKRISRSGYLLLRDSQADLVHSWWDAALLPNKSYDRDDQCIRCRMPQHSHSGLAGHDALYPTPYPIPFPGFGEKNKVNLRPLKLTAKEQKKTRKQRWQAELQDKRGRIRMGLIPPDPPKVRLANLMKVLTSDAVQDPTRVEARHTHEKMNAERKLTDEQRRERIENKKLEEDKKGICGAVFKVKNLSDPAHRFNARKNVEQMNLTGLCIFNPAFSMVYVEGAPKLIRQYKRLMLYRIAWTDSGSPSRRRRWEARADDAVNGEGEGVTSLEDNACYLVWEGQLRERSFNSFKPRSCPTDATAKEALGQKLAAYWDMTKNWKPEEEELF